VSHADAGTDARRPSRPAPVLEIRADFHTDATIALPKTGAPGHVELLRSALDLPLTPQDMAALDRAFPLPKRKAPLEMI